MFTSPFWTAFVSFVTYPITLVYAVILLGAVAIWSVSEYRRKRRLAQAAKDRIQMDRDWGRAKARHPLADDWTGTL